MSWKIHPFTWALVILLTGLGLAFVWHYNEPYWLKRFGALIAATSGLLVVRELWLERKELSNSKSKKSDIQVSKYDDHSITLRERLKVRIANARIHAKRLAESDRKETYTLSHILGACYGEFLHGWGDLLIKWVGSLIKLLTTLAA